MDCFKDDGKTRRQHNFTADVHVGSVELPILFVHQGMRHPYVQTSATLPAGGAVALLVFCAAPLFVMMAAVAHRLEISEDYVRCYNLF